MDFDYQTIKDRENAQRAEVLCSLSALHSRGLASSNAAPQSPPALHRPPVKPRRSIKSRLALQEKSTSLATMSSSAALEPLSTPLRAQTLLWFETSQLPRLRRPGQPLPCWLHGFATRREAEELLKDKEQGCFLLRLSESKIGFVLSYRGKDRCRHFIIEEEGDWRAGGSWYVIAGEQSRHGSLEELVTFYTQHPVGPFDEVLTVPFAQEESHPHLSDVERKEGVSEGAEERGVGGGDAGGGDAAVVPESTPPRSANTLAPPATDTCQYAVVKKALKKSYSLPEPHPEENRETPGLEAPDATAPLEQDGTGAEGGVDAPYAQVNKLPRATSQQGHAPPAEHEPGGEHKYWEMVPLHTYEETQHLTQRSGGSGQQIECSSTGGAEGGHSGSQHHLYSEIRVRERGVLGTVQIAGRAAPELPRRPPPRGTHCRLSAKIQEGNTTDPPPRPRAPIPTSTEMPRPDPHSSIYEEIPERRGFSP